MVLWFALGFLARGGPLVRESAGEFRMPMAPPAGGFTLPIAWPERFRHPVAMASPPGETNRLFVCEREGIIVCLTNLVAPSRYTYLDVVGSTASGFIEAGLLGLAFHPGYATNGWFFIYRTRWMPASGGEIRFFDTVSRFQDGPGRSAQEILESETLIFAHQDENWGHNAGDLKFGPDGYLYISIGHDAPHFSATTSDTETPIDRHHFGAILRIDVDGRPGSQAPHLKPGVTSNYRIPPDNPFIGTTRHHGVAVDPEQVCTELYAIGLRNPWRMDFDPISGDLFSGDVGEQTFEEVNVIQAGGHYGWPYFDGFGPLMTDGIAWKLPPPDFTWIPPLVAYQRTPSTNSGSCVVGGVVYRGSQAPLLDGAFVYADFISGNVWAVRRGTPDTEAVPRWLLNEPGLTCFTREPGTGEVLAADMDDGVIRRLVYQEGGGPTPFPALLSTTGAFSNLATLQAAPGVVPFSINVPFWSDHALKQRWFCLPDPQAQFGFHAVEPWAFPAGAVWIKHFDLELTNGIASSRRRLETRFIVATTNDFYGVTYKWRDDQSDAELLPPEGKDEIFLIHDGDLVRTQRWHYPSQGECRRCHNATAGAALGFNTAQLNRTFHYPNGSANQLTALQEAGYLATGPLLPETLRALRPTADETAPIAERGRSYLAANCAQCHRADKRLPLSSTWDARDHVPLAETGLPVLLGAFSVSGAPPILLGRIEADELRWRMPPMGGNIVDTNAVALLERWAAGIVRPPWQAGDLGEVEREGSADFGVSSIEVAGYGSGIHANGDSIYFLRQPLDPNLQIIGRWTGDMDESATGESGLRIQAGAGAPRDAMATLGFRSSGEVVWSSRAVSGALPERAQQPAPGGQHWLRMVLRDSVVSGYVASARGDWIPVGNVALPESSAWLAGLWAASDDPLRVHRATFNEVRVMSVGLDAPLPAAVIPFETPIQLVAKVRAWPSNAVARCELMADGLMLASFDGEPYAFSWTNATPGPHELTARVLDVDGSAVESKATRIVVTPPPAVAGYLGRDDSTHGRWLAKYGKVGWALPTLGERLPPQATFQLGEGVVASAVAPLNKTAALTYPSGLGLLAATWSAPNPLTFDLSLDPQTLRRVALYLAQDPIENDLVRIVVRDAYWGTLLEERIEPSAQNGAYFLFGVRGEVRFECSSTKGATVRVAGVFVDRASCDLPIVQIIDPTPASGFSLPQSIEFEARVTSSSSTIESVEFRADDELIGEVFTAPYRYRWERPTAGRLSVRAHAFDALGCEGVSEPISIDTVLPAAGAALVSVDTTTAGDWPAKYGSEGAVLFGSATNVPSWVSFSLPEAGAYTWPSAEDPRAPISVLNPAERVPTFVYSYGALAMTVGVNDGRWHRFTTYCVDWQGLRKSVIRITDPSDGRLLLQDPMDSFAAGMYRTYRLRGRVLVEIENIQVNAVLNAVFFDPDRSIAPGLPKYDSWLDRYFAPALNDPTEFSADPDHDGASNLYEYVVGTDPTKADRPPMPAARHTENCNEFLFYARADRDDVLLAPESSPDLEHWTALDLTNLPQQVSTNDGLQEVRICVPAEPSGVMPLFLRLRIVPRLASPAASSVRIPPR